MLPMGAILMTFECGMRFLADHLEGDHYFRIHRENQNLDRARTQFKLVWDMEQKLSEMKSIVEKYNSGILKLAGNKRLPGIINTYRSKETAIVCNHNNASADTRRKISWQF